MKCRRLQERRGKNMEDLSVHRLEEALLFTYCWVDIFGPFVIKQCRNEIKRYGAMFTCMANGALIIEMTQNLETLNLSFRHFDELLLALQRKYKDLVFR